MKHQGFTPFRTLSHAAAELSGNCAGIELKPPRLIRENGGFPQSPGKRIARQLNWICAAAALAACQTPAVKDRIVEVSVPIATKPLKPEQVPAVPAPLGPRPQSLSAAADVLLSKVCELEAYALKADPLLRLSAGMQQKALARFPECEGR